MSMKEREDDKGDDKRRSVKIVGDSKKTSDLKSLKEMKEYLRSEFEKKTDFWEKNRGGTFLHFAAYLGDVDALSLIHI